MSPLSTLIPLVPTFFVGLAAGLALGARGVLALLGVVLLHGLGLALDGAQRGSVGQRGQRRLQLRRARGLVLNDVRTDV